MKYPISLQTKIKQAMNYMKGLYGMFYPAYEILPQSLDDIGLSEETNTQLACEGENQAL